MTTLILTRLFDLWAWQFGCPDATMLRSIEIVEAPWLLHIESASACGHLLQSFESVSMSHGDTMNIVYLVDGDRAHDVPNINVIIQNATPLTPEA